jgi:hypothetical protein
MTTVTVEDLKAIFQAATLEGAALVRNRSLTPPLSLLVTVDYF